MSKFVLNSKIELIDGNGESIFGLIHDIVDDKLYVSTTSIEKNLKLLHIDDAITGLVFNGSKGKSFEGVVTDRKSDEILIYEISNICNIKAVQRRQDVRVDCCKPVYYTDNKIFLKLDNDNLNKVVNKVKDVSKKGVTLDLSGGGMKLSLSEKFNPGQNLVVLFYIEDKPIIVKCRLLHKSIKIVDNSTLYDYGVEFLDITEAEREAIIKYLFVLMRKNRIR